MNALLLLFLSTMIAGSLALTLGGGYEVVKDIDADDEEAEELLRIITKPRKPKDYHVVYETAFGSLQSHFSWTDCGGSDEAHIQSFSLSPDPLRLPGNITVGFTWETTVDLIAPISLNLKVEKKIGFLWIPIPCHLIPGSCHHDDLCAELARVSCPTEYQPCHCPLKKGTYTLPPTTIPIPQGGIPSGDYRLTVWLSQGSTEVGCFHTQLAVD